jgi:DNA-binding transcriptional ArsR family regulator
MPKVWATVGWIESSGVLGSKSLPVKTRVLLYLIRYGDKSLESWHSKSKIGQALGVSRIHVQNELKALEDDGIVERHPDARNGKVRLRKHVFDSHRSGDYIVTAPVTLRRQEEGPASSNTKPEDPEQRRRRIAAEAEQKYGADWKDFAFCGGCMRAGIGLRWTADKWSEQLKRLLPVYECKDCADERL